ncbi:MAG: AI-2E family transporter [Rhizobiaceae bacterium]
MSLPPLVTIVGVTAILYLGRDVFLPFAIALLLTFALAPIVSFLRRRSIPKILAVIITVGISFAFIAAFAFLVASQVSNLAQNIPTYQTNIVEKVRSLRELGAGGGLVDHVTRVIERVGEELRLGTQPAGPAENAPKPLHVEIVSQESPLDLLQNIVVPLISPFATAGLVLVVVVFMLLEREALRDRFIRLAGYGDLHTTTEALQDAGTRVGRYLLMQLVINTIYAIPIVGGLWLLGIPNALLWGLLTLVLRFVPYIGPAIGMMLPMLVTLAVTPGWAPLLWTAALFLVMELLSNNVLEPWLYGSHTGLSPLAIIVAAIFWAWLWGPLGLVLSTPLTVCLVVLGRHVPQFEFLNVLLGNEPVLEPHARVYQRLLAGDPDEAADYAEEFLQDAYLVDFYDRVGIPALILGEQDRQRGVMTEEKQSQFAAAARSLVDDLEEVADDEEEDNGDEADNDEDSIADDLPDGEGHFLLCMGGRGAIDDAAAVMLAQVMEVQGATVTRALHSALGLTQLRRLELDGVDTVVLTYLNTASAAQARHAVRRLKRLKRKLRVGVFMPKARPDLALPTAEALNADFVVSAIADAVKNSFADEKPVPLRAPPKRLSPRHAKPRKRAAAAT